MGIAWILMKITARIVWRGTYWMMPLSTHLFSHWSIPLSRRNSLQSSHLFVVCWAGTIDYTSNNMLYMYSLHWYKIIKKFLIYKEIQKGAVAKSYMTKGIFIYVWLNICAFPHILGSPSSYMTWQLLPSEFPYIWGKFSFLFYQCTVPWRHRGRALSRSRTCRRRWHTRRSRAPGTGQTLTILAIK